MLNGTVILKVKERVNKLDSRDYDNIEVWQIVEAVNKAQVEWARRQLTSLNPQRQGDEQSRRRVDDLQVLLVTVPSPFIDREIFYESPLPADYLAFKRIDMSATSQCCSKPQPFKVWLAEELNVTELLRDPERKPSWDWTETFATLAGNNAKVFKDDFTATSIDLTYYRMPRKMQVVGTSDPYSLAISTVEAVLEFKEDIVELIISEACAIIAGDIESTLQVQRNTQDAERSN
jgi:hypothetical protein